MIILMVAAAIILGLIPGVVASQKGHSLRLWWAFGAVLFPITLPMALLLPTTPMALRRRERDLARERDFRECPACHDDIRSEATACPYCHCNVAPTRIAITDEPALREPASRRRVRPTLGGSRPTGPFARFMDRDAGR